MKSQQKVNHPHWTQLHEEVLGPIIKQFATECENSQNKMWLDILKKVVAKQAKAK